MRGVYFFPGYSNSFSYESQNIKPFWECRTCHKTSEVSKYGIFGEAHRPLHEENCPLKNTAHNYFNMSYVFTQWRGYDPGSPFLNLKQYLDMQNLVKTSINRGEYRTC